MSTGSAKNSPSSSSKGGKEASSSTASAAAREGGGEDAAEKVSAGDVDADLLPVLHDVIRTVEKDNQDPSQKNKDSLEASQKVQEIHGKISALREQIYKLSGIEQSKEEQLRQLEVLKQQLQMKKKLILKYKELNLKVSGLSGQNSY